MKVASWNVNSLHVRLPHLRTWLGDAQPDVVALQETKTEDAKFPAAALDELGYHSVFSGQKTYNGVALLSRQPARDVMTDIPGLDDQQRRILVATVGDLRIVNLYVVNGQSVGSEKYAYKLDWLAKMHDFLAAEVQRFPQMIVLGDFNIDRRDDPNFEAFTSKGLGPPD
ncbi:MAG: exodeoxyribonuclease III, partial [Hyphomicrobium sp.]